MITVKLTSKISKREITKSYTAMQFLNFYGAEDVVEDMTKCDCTQLHESGFSLAVVMRNGMSTHLKF